VTKGCAVFRDVRLEGAPGTAYLLRVGSASRKVALRETSLPVEVSACADVGHARGRAPALRVLFQDSDSLDAA
jgi:hypothetical protein